MQRASRKEIGVSLRSSFGHFTLEDTLIKNYRNVSLILSTVLFLTMLSFISFFMYNPFAAGVSILALAQAASLLGWVLLTVLPPLLLSVEIKFRTFSVLFLISALLWPAALILIRFVLFVQIGDPAMTYLYSFPIFLFTDIIVPILYVLMWRSISRTVLPTKAGRRVAEFAPAEKVLQS
jgi:hypothetical protein